MDQKILIPEGIQPVTYRPKDLAQGRIVHFIYQHHPYSPLADRQFKAAVHSASDKYAHVRVLESDLKPLLAFFTGEQYDATFAFPRMTFFEVPEVRVNGNSKA